MSLRWRSGGWHYDIELSSQMPDGLMRTRVYETTRIICDSANSMRGRATRVYEASVKDLEDASITRTVVVKDSWIDVGRSKEGDTLAALLESATLEEKELFLTVIQHGVVRVNGQDDSTEGLILRGQTLCSPPVDEALKLDNNEDSIFAEEMGMLSVDEHDEVEDKLIVNQPMPKPLSYETRLYPLYRYPPPSRSDGVLALSRSNATKASTRENVIGSLPHHTHRVLRPYVVYSPKVHYRIAFEEVGKSLLSVADSGKLRVTDVSQALRDTTLGEKTSMVLTVM